MQSYPLLLSSLSNSITQLAGTLEFIPPEERGADSVESSDKLSRQRNDLYAFGKVVYCAVTGNGPHEYPAVPKELPLTLPLKYFLRLSFQLCSKDPVQRLDSIDELTCEFADIERKLFYGEKFADKFKYAAKRFISQVKSTIFSSLHFMKRFWYLVLLFLLIGGGAAYWIWKPEKPFDITKVKSKEYKNSEHQISMMIPFHWEIISKDIYKKMINETWNDKKNKNFTEKQRNAVLEDAKLGQDAIFCDFDEKFADNITIAVLPFSQKEMVETSEDEFRVFFKSFLEGELKFKTEIYTSKKTIIAGFPAIFLDYSYMPNIRVNGYWIARPDKTIVITLTAKDKTFLQRQTEFNSVFATLKFTK